MLERIALLSDIHGNRPALEAVLADLSRRGVGRILNLGDILYGPLDPVGTHGLLSACSLPVRHIRGNGDRLLYEIDGVASPTVGYCRAALPASALSWLESLPACLCEGDIYACHGSPRSDTEYLLEEMGELGGTLRPTTELEAMLAGLPQCSLVVCGHSHLPWVVKAGSRLVVNPGSVGLPAYADDAPRPHKMETGSPWARYAIVERQPDRGWAVEQLCLEYDWEKAARLADANGRPDWSGALRSGRA